MRIVVTGREGQVARALAQLGPSAGHEVVTVSRPEFELSGEASQILASIGATRPDAIISAAAYTAVDRAESEPELAFAVNELGARAVAQGAFRLGVPLVHLSTDYVFDGTKAAPYSETDATGPTGVYGASKLAGEQAVLTEHSDCAILRTAWVYSPFGVNFAKTMLRIAASRNEVAVVDDQRGNPTSAFDIAEALIAVACNLKTGKWAEQRGIFHMTSSGDCSWADFAQAIFAASEKLGGPSALVRRITSAEYPTRARRPANSRLNSERLALAHHVRLPDWRKSLQPVVARLVAEHKTAELTSR